MTGVSTVRTPTWAVRFGAAHDPNPTTQVPPLRPVIRSRPAQPLPPEILRSAVLPASQQGRQPAALAGLAQGQRLLPRVGQPPAGEGLATGPSGLLAEAAPEVSRLTRSLPAASPYPSRRYAHLNAARLTRCHPYARSGPHWTCSSVNRQRLTGSHRFDHPAAGTVGPADSGTRRVATANLAAGGPETR